MNRSHAYTEYHPRWLRSRVSPYWWLSRRSYLAFILRELSAIFVAWLVVFLLLLINAASQGAAAYEQFLGWSGRPLVLLLNFISLFFVLFHTITWFNLSPQAMVLHVRGRRVPGYVISASNYVAWLVASVLVAWLVVGG